MLPYISSCVTAAATRDVCITAAAAAAAAAAGNAGCSGGLADERQATAVRVCEGGLSRRTHAREASGVSGKRTYTGNDTVPNNYNE